MDFQQAMAWVSEHESAIKGYIAKYRNFSPYEECDYMQEAFEAAMIVVDLGRRASRVAHGVQYHAGSPHDVAAGKHTGDTGHLVAIYGNPSPIVHGKVREIA